MSSFCRREHTRTPCPTDRVAPRKNLDNTRELIKNGRSCLGEASEGNGIRLVLQHDHPGSEQPAHADARGHRVDVAVIDDQNHVRGEPR